jgi:hypothetical protein
LIFGIFLSFFTFDLLQKSRGMGWGQMLDCSLPPAMPMFLPHEDDFGIKTEAAFFCIP